MKKSSKVATDDEQRARLEALDFTWRIISEFRDGSFAGRDPIVTRFPPSLGPGEKMFCFGDYQRAYFGVGDAGVSSTFVAGGTGVLGLGMLAATGAAAMSAKGKAQAASVPAWRFLDAGSVFISDRGFYLESRSGLFSFSFESLAEADMVSPAVMQFGANMAGGVYQRFRLHANYAEMMMLTWAWHRHPSHPFLVSYLAHGLRDDSGSLPPPPRQIHPPKPTKALPPVDRAAGKPPPPPPPTGGL